MLVQVALLAERHAAPVHRILEGTFKRFFASVDSEVIVEVMPLSEIHPTTLKFALQYF